MPSPPPQRQVGEEYRTGGGMGIINVCRGNVMVGYVPGITHQQRHVNERQRR